MIKYSVLTYVFNGDEFLRDVPKDEEIEYVCVTDNRELKSDVWKIIVDEDLVGMDPLYASFYVRYHPFKYCTGDVCLRMDGSIRIKQSLLPLFEYFDKSENDICVMVSSRSNTIRKELMFWMNPKHKDVKEKQIKLYENLGIDIDKEGVIQSPISITRNSQICNNCDDVCWSMIEELSTPDVIARPSQVIMTVAISLNPNLKIMFVDENLIQSEIMQWCKHNSDNIRRSMFFLKHNFFFDKPIKIHNFDEIYCNNDVVRGTFEVRKPFSDIFNIKQQSTSWQNLCSSKLLRFE